MKKIASVLVASGLLAIGSTAASAASYTFHFSDDYLVGGDAKTKTFRSVESPSMTVDVSGHYYSMSDGGYNGYGSADVDLNSYGLISRNYGESGSPAHAIDSWGHDESMKFSFSQLVSLTGAYVSWAYSNFSTAQWDVFEDGQLAGINSGAGWTSLNLGEADNFAIGTRTYKRCFFGRYCFWDQSAIKLKSIVVEHTPSEVPLPAAGWMLLAGLGGLVAMRKRST